MNIENTIIDLHEAIKEQRKNLEYLVYRTLEQKDPIISINRGREMLGFSTMDEMRNWRDQYHYDKQCGW